LITVVGCGGNRDKQNANNGCNSSELSDMVVLTSDNPRNEDAIIKEMEQGGLRI
jgi:UDP-N-acetylmuramyl tripeptide synthase